jgi:LDH2 family malate/lactate/ureidoglycolate dehydrogenase
MKVKVSELKKLLVKIISANYYTQEQARVITDILIWAELTGKSNHGTLKLLGPEPIQNIKPEKEITITKQTSVSMMIDGGGAAGPLPANFATDKTIELAKKSGIAFVTMNNTFSSTCALGYYAEKIAKQDLIAYLCSSSPKAQAHYGSIDPTYGTNPLAYGFPSENEPIVFDMATSAVTFYSLVRASLEGEQIPEGIAIDKDGKPTRDAAAAMEGAILPFDRSYKGSDLAMSIEILAGVLSGAHYVFGEDEGDWGSLFVAIDPEIFIGKTEFKKRVSDLIIKVKSQRHQTGMEIKIPGLEMASEIGEKLAKDEVEINDDIYNDLLKLQQ